MTETYKEQLSRHVEGIFKNYTVPGLHICDIATGGGKSYTIGKLTCEYYPNEFDRIIILCVQNKLVDSMNREIDRFINGGNSQISPIDKMVIENNPEVIIKAVNNGSFQRLLDKICYRIGEQKQKGHKVKDLQYAYNAVRKTFEGLSSLVKTLDDNGKNALFQFIGSDASPVIGQRFFAEQDKGLHTYTLTLPRVGRSISASELQA